MRYTIQQQDLTYVYTILNGDILIFQRLSDGQEAIISVSHQNAKRLAEAILALIPEAEQKEKEHSEKALK